MCVGPSSSLMYALVAKRQDINCFDKISGAIYGCDRDFCEKPLGQFTWCFIIQTSGGGESGGGGI